MKKNLKVIAKFLPIIAILAMASGCACQSQARNQSKHKPLFAAGGSYNPNDILYQDQYGQLYFGSGQ